MAKAPDKPKSKKPQLIKINLAIESDVAAPVYVERSVDSWGQLTQLIKEYSTGKWIFRGVTQSSYRLIPKIGREEARKDPANGDPRPFSAPNEKKMVTEFERLARPYFMHRPVGPLEVMGVGQHHGLPTRLLDWTESPLFAAYFAVKKAGTEEYQPAIFAATEMPEMFGDADPFQIKEMALYRPPHISPRIPAQQSVFTVQPVPNQETFRAGQIHKWLLPEGRGAFEIKMILDTCGINQSSLFPDIDGLSAYVGWRYKWDRFV